MANLEKLLKAWDVFKTLPQQLSEDVPSRSKEKISFCVSVADTFCSTQNLKSGGANVLLSFAVESLLQFCNDCDSDVRMTADESLNRIIRQAIMENHAMKIQIELHKEIKRNGNVRSLRAALWRFAYLCHLIRPQKGKPYINNLIPCLILISKRTEESLQETLAIAMPRIFKTLGVFALDKDVKALLKAYVSNLSSDSAQIRRTAGSCIVSICQYCRKPQVFLTEILNTLVDLLVPIQDYHAVFEILGILGCLRSIIPLLVSLTDQNISHSELKGSFGVQRRHEKVSLGVDRMIQVYELSIHFSKHADHNVVNAALELLYQILVSPPPGLLPILLLPHGIPHSRILISDDKNQSNLTSLNESESVVPESDETVLLEQDADLPIAMSTLMAPPPFFKLDSSNMSTDEESKDIASLTIGTGTLQLLDAADPSEPEPLAIYDDAIESTLSLDKVSINMGEETSGIEEFIQVSTHQSALVDHGSPPPSATSLSICSPATGISQDDVKYQVCDIGSLTDGSIPLVYCARHLATSFLLTGHPGYRMPDRCVRVSVKALALNCVAAIVRLHPNVFQLYLDKEPVSPSRRSSNSRGSSQPLCDMLLYSKHTDPQLRAICCTLVAFLVRSVLVQSGGNWRSWQRKADSKVARCLELSHLILYLVQGLEDESSTTCRQTIVSLTHFFSDLLSSRDSFEALPVLQVLPSLSRNPYWLVKVKLVELVSELPYITIEFICSSSAFQEKVINDILLKLLDDEDSRVRKASAEAVVRIIPNLCFLMDYDDANTVNTVASYLSQSHLNSIFQVSDDSAPQAVYRKSQMPAPNLENLTPPFDALNNKRRPQSSKYVESSLSRLVYALSHLLLQSSSKHLTLGCCETLSLLATKYPPTVFINAWNCTSKTATSPNTSGKSEKKMSPSHCSPASGLLHTVLSLLANSSIALDLATIQWLTSLAGNLFCGMAVANMLPLDRFSSGKIVEHVQVPQSQLWSMFQDKQLVIAAESILLHVMRTLNIILHILDDTNPIPSATKPGLPSLSPIKRHASAIGKSAPASSDSPSETKSGRGLSPIRNIIHGEKEEKSDEKRGNKNLPYGSFSNNHHYMKVYELLRSAHANFKMSLEAEVSEKFISVVSTILEVLSQLLEVMTVIEAGRLAEEMLSYLRTTMLLSPVSTVHCVNQLLKCVVGMNLVSFWSDSSSNYETEGSEPFPNLLEKGHGFYFHCFSQPCQLLHRFLETSVVKPTNVEVAHAAEWMSSSFQRCDSRTVFTLGKTADTSFLASYIRLFEPVVIESLQQYTVTSDVQLQVKVLLLLTQLVQLRVNYCLLDSEMVFIGFIHKQFEFIEEGQILNAEALITAIFHFMVLLSFEKHHSKSITTIPKVIQLCDGLMASGQNPLTHCIPALLPVVEHGFLSKGSVSAVIDAEELETQREVMVAMLLRLVEYHQVMELLNLVLIECRGWHDGEERWTRWSHQVSVVVLGLLTSGRLRLDSLPAQQALHHLLLHSIAPSVFRPLDPLLKVLFVQPPQLESSTEAVIRWLGTVLSMILALTVHGEEEAILTRIDELNISLPTPFFRVAAVDLTSPDPLNVTAVSAKPHSSASPQLTFARLLLCAIGFVGEKIDSIVMDPTSSADILKECQYLQELLAHFLLVCIYLFQSGSHGKITSAAVELVAGYTTEDSVLLEDANAVFLEVAPACPLLMFLWCYLLTLLNYNNHAYWKRVLYHSSHSSSNCDENEYSNTGHSVTMEVVRTGAAIVYCSFVCGNPSETEQLSWLLKTQMMQIIELSTEPPVQEFISVLHRSPDHCKNILESFYGCCFVTAKATTIVRVLRFLEGIHPSQSGALLVLLVERFVGLPHPALARRAAQLCTRQAEYLLTLSPPHAAEQISREQLRDLLHLLHRTHLNRKHTGLVSILNKLGSQCLALSPLETDEARPLTASSIQSLKLDKDWYLSQVKLRCSQASYTAVAFEESAHLLGKLEVEDAVSVLSSPDTHLSILHVCFRLGTHQTIQAQIDNHSSSHFEDSLSPLYRAARMVLMQHVHHFIELVPKEHQVFLPFDRLMTASEKTYSQKFQKVLSNDVQLESVFRVAAAVSSYLHSLEKLCGTVPSEATHDLAAFALFSLEAVHCLVHGQSAALGFNEVVTLPTKQKTKSMEIHEDSDDSKNFVDLISCSNLSLKYVKSPPPYCLKLGLDCASQVLNELSLGVHFERPEHSSWLASACSSVCAVLHFALHGEALPSVPPNGLDNSLSKLESLSIGHACHQMSVLVAYLEKLSHGLCNHSIPSFLFGPLKKLVIRLSRAPLLNSYVWIPPEVWRHGWDVTLSGPHFTLVPPLPTEFLQDMEVLKQFIFRVTLLGWTSRQQFEETWMSLLSVLSAESLVDEMPADELILTVQANTLVIKAITALLLQTILLPMPGNPNTSEYMHTPRNKSLDRSSKSLTKLFQVQQLLIWKLEGRQGKKVYSVFNSPNLEHDIFIKRYGYNQMSVDSLRYVLARSQNDVRKDNYSEAVVSIFERRFNALEISGLDLNSCIFFLLDLFTQWIQPQVIGVMGQHSRLLHEVLCSALAVSDLFTEQSQWLWLLQMSLDLAKNRPSEDDISHQYIILAQCKACAVLQPETEVSERVRRIVENALKSNFIPTVAAGLHGLLYLLEGLAVSASSKKAKTLQETAADVPVDSSLNLSTSPSISQDSFGVVNVATGYILKSLTSPANLSINDELYVLMWSVAFFILDNITFWRVESLDQALPVILQHATLLGHSGPQYSPRVQRVITQGLERLVVSQSEALSPEMREQITKFAVESLGDTNSTLLVHSLQLLLSCMYMGCKDSSTSLLWKSNDMNPMDPEELVQAMEKTSALFDRIKKGYPHEVELICSVLPHILTDFFPASEVLTKVIGEFLSPQQPHPRLLSGVVFQVFECAVAQSQLSLLQEWFVLSLSNFTQTLPVPMATWCLTCFFISASCNPWLRALFPHVQSRIGRCEFEDRKLLCLSASDFYRQLSSDSQTRKFFSTFQAAAERQPNSPFMELISSLN